MRIAPIGVITASLIWSILNLFSAGPRIMADELIYSRSAIYLSPGDSPFGNYLFSLLAAWVTSLAPDAYSGIKVMNLILGLVTLLGVYAFGKLFLEKEPLLWTVALASLFATSQYSQLFMPESLFFALLVWSLVFVAQSGSSQSLARGYLNLGLSGALLGLAALTKPHAFLFLPAFLLIWLFNSRQFGKASLMVKFGLPLLAFVLVRFGIGYVVFGERTLTLFPGYLSGGGNQVDGVFYRAQDLFFTPNSTDQLELGSYFQDVLSQGSLFSAVGIAMVGPLIVIPFLAFLMVKPLSKQTNFEDSLLWMGSTLCLNGFAITIFSAPIFTFFGDDHSDRILMRYWEPLIALLAVVAYGWIARQKSNFLAAVALLAFGTFSIARHLLQPEGVLEVTGADSMLVFASSLANLGWLFIGFVFILGFAFFFEKVRILRSVTLFSVFAVLAISGSISTFYNGRDLAGNIDGTLAGKAISNLELGIDASVAIIGGSRAEVSTAAFEAQLPQIEIFLAPKAVDFDVSELSKTYDYVLFTADVYPKNFEKSYQLVLAQDEFGLYKSIQGSTIRFSSAASQKVDIQGDYSQGVNFITNQTPKITLKIAESVQKGQKIRVKLRLPEVVENRKVLLGFQGRIYELDVTDSDAFEFDFPVESSQDFFELTFASEVTRLEREESPRIGFTGVQIFEATISGLN